MSLAKSLDQFKDTLNDLTVSSNIDFPEGGFVALLQVQTRKHAFIKLTYSEMLKVLGKMIYLSYKV